MTKSQSPLRRWRKLAWGVDLAGFSLLTLVIAPGLDAIGVIRGIIFYVLLVAFCLWHYSDGLHRRRVIEDGVSQ